MIRPLLQDDALLEDIRGRPLGERDFAVWWLGQSGFLLRWRGRHLLFDPYLSDSLTAKYAATDKPHVRMTELAVAPHRLDFVDVATSSHNHTDHLDADTLVPLRTANPDLQLVLPAANVGFARERLAASPPAFVGIDDATSAEAGGFRFTGVAAAHEEVERDPDGRCKFLGFLVEFGGWCVFHSGDTLWHDGLVHALLPKRPHLMLLPINGRNPERRVAGNLNGTEAAALARSCSAGTVVPCHYEMFEFNSESPSEFRNACERLGQPHAVLRCGEAWTSDSLPTPPPATRSDPTELA